MHYKVMTMYSTSIYESWTRLQKEKFRKIKNRMSNKTLADMFKNKLVLDIGCGSGLFEKEFNVGAIGVDNDPDMAVKTAADFEKVLGDGDRMPFRKESFDSVVCVDTAHLLKRNDFLRVLKPGGFGLFSVFFNDGNYLERRKMLHEKLKGMIITDEFELDTREKEIIIIALKPTSR